MPDVINARHLEAVSGGPALSEPIAEINDQRGWLFTGVSPISWTGEITIRHVFMVIKIDEGWDVLPQGVFTGINEGQLIVLEPGGSSLSALGAGETYLNGIATEETAPAEYSLIEVVYEDGVSLDGIQIGMNPPYFPEGNGTNFQGVCVESLAYSVVLNDLQRLQIKQYIAERYHIWEQAVSLLPPVEEEE
jgi:hypothetical protein